MGGPNPEWSHLNELLCFDLLGVPAAGGNEVDAMMGVLSSRHSDFPDMTALARRLGLSSWREADGSRPPIKVGWLRQEMRMSLHAATQAQTAPFGLTWRQDKVGLLSSHKGTTIVLQALDGHLRFIRPQGRDRRRYQGATVNFRLEDEAALKESLDRAASWFATNVAEELGLSPDAWEAQTP